MNWLTTIALHMELKVAGYKVRHVLKLQKLEGQGNKKSKTSEKKYGPWKMMADII